MVHLHRDGEVLGRFVAEFARRRSRHVRDRLADGDPSIMACATKPRGLRVIYSTYVREQRRLVAALAFLRRRRMRRSFAEGDRAIMTAEALSRSVLEMPESMT